MTRLRVLIAALTLAPATALGAEYRAVRWTPASNALDYVVCAVWEESGDTDCKIALAGVEELPLSQFALRPSQVFHFEVQGRGEAGELGPWSLPGDSGEAGCVLADLDCDGVVGGPDFGVLSARYGRRGWEVWP